MRRCVLCGSDRIMWWLGGSLGELYHCPDCLYTGPLVVDIDDGVVNQGPSSDWDSLEEKSVWSETGIANSTLFQT